MSRRSTLIAAALGAALAAAACRDAVAPPRADMVPPPSLSEAVKTWQCLADQGASVTKGAPGADGGDAAATIAAPDGEVITRVAVKAGSDCWLVPAGIAGDYTIQVDGSACFRVEGLGTPAVTVTRVGETPTCKNITHVEYVSALAAPTTGLLEICKAIAARTLPEGSQIFVREPFTFVVAGVTVTIGEAETYLNPLTCAAPIELVAGEYTITQSPKHAWSDDLIYTDPEDRLISKDVSVPTATVLVVAGSTTRVTFETLDPGDPQP